jgi:hypothetical protein
MRRIIVCGPPHSGKSVFLANLMRQLPPDSFYLAFAAPDGEWHWSNFGDQDLVAAVRQKGKFTEDFVSNMVNAVSRNEQPLVLVDTGGIRSEANERIFDACDGCIILSSKPEEIVAWREFAIVHDVAVVAELDSVLHGTCELYGEQGDGVIRGRISGLERGHTIKSVTLEAVSARLRKVIEANWAYTLAEMTATVNGSGLSGRLGVEDMNDPFLGIRPQHLPAALRLTAAATELNAVRIWNVRAAILASAYAASFPDSVELYDVNAGYIKLPELTPKGTGNGSGAIEWETIDCPEYFLVKWRTTRFITKEDLSQVVPPVAPPGKPVVITNEAPPMWLHATLVRAYARAGATWVGQFWPVESGRAQAHLDGRQWDEIYPDAGPAVVVSGPSERIGEVFPISFTLLRPQAPVMGHLATGEVVVDAANSHVATHPTVLAVLPEALGQIGGGDEQIVTEVDLGRVIGENIRVATSDADEIVYAQRTGRRGLTRFVKNREPEDCTSVVVILRKITGGAYVLVTAFIGTHCPAEPWDQKYADKESVPFWNSHALIWGAEEVVEDTETTECPW